MLYLIEWNLLYSNEHQHLFEATSQQQAIGSHNYGKGKKHRKKANESFSYGTDPKTIVYSFQFLPAQFHNKIHEHPSLSFVLSSLYSSLHLPKNQ